jgi:RND superfamily putative drug exporter
VKALSSWCFRHRLLVAAGWLLMVAVLAVLGRTAAYSNTFTVPGTDSTTALNLLTKAAPGPERLWGWRVAGTARLGRTPR